eukprot:365900-Chlamydomonas_euryale.AAC.19
MAGDGMWARSSFLSCAPTCRFVDAAHACAAAASDSNVSSLYDMPAAAGAGGPRRRGGGCPGEGCAALRSPSAGGAPGT